MADEHGVGAKRRLTTTEGDQVASVMQALATGSRVRILDRLREAPSNVGALAEALDMEQPAVSQQLKVLRDLGLVAGTRSGRHTFYELHDSHVATLLDEVLRHLDHLDPTH